VRQATAEVYFPPSGSLEAVMLAVLLEHQRQIEEVRQRLMEGCEGRPEGSPVFRANYESHRQRLNGVSVSSEAAR
jgi:hypothetical protein